MIEAQCMIASGDPDIFQLSLVEFEFFNIDPTTMYDEDFVDSINNILNTQSLNSSVVGVLVSDQVYEESML